MATVVTMPTWAFLLLCAVFTAVNLLVLAMGIKLFTEYAKDQFQKGRR